MKIKKHLFLFLLTAGLLAGFLFLSACAQSGAQAPQATAEPLTPEPTAPPVSPTEAPIQPTPPPTPTSPDAALAARQLLARQAGADLADVRVLSIEPVNWPDACLGVAKPGQMCAQVITPGYRVALELNGQQYVFHTDGSGSQIVQASSPQEPTQGALLSWTEESQSACNQLMLTVQALNYGDCGVSLAESPEVFNQVRDDLLAFAGKYAPFSAETRAGKIEFNGAGSETASPAEQRRIAEWARMTFQIAQSGQADTSWGLVLNWRRDGGIAAFCDEVTIYLSGFASASSCKGPAFINLGRVQLTPAQLEQVYTWVDTLASFDYEATDPATTDAMTIHMTFNGQGQAKTSSQDVQAMQDLANDLLNQLKIEPNPVRTLEARKALETYFTALREARYADAAALYGGDPQVLADWNPDLDPTGLHTLFERGCTTNGLVCNLSISRYLGEARVSPTDYRFTVELSNPDGTPFSRGPCCGADPQTDPPETSFTFTVREVDGAYTVLDLPVYVP